MGATAIKRKPSLKAKIIVFMVVSSALGLFLFMDFKIKPVLKTISASKAKIIASEVINSAIMEDMAQNSSEYENITVIKTGNVGEVLSVSLAMCKINALKSRINMLIQNKFSDFKEKTFYISLGTLLGWEILNGQGPEVPVKISSSGSVNSDFKSEFSGAGINQTLHRVYLNVHARISVMIPGDSCVCETDSDILVSEVVIVGATPQMCTGIGQREIYSLTNPKEKD